VVASISAAGAVLRDPGAQRSENYTATDGIVVELSRDLREARRLPWTVHVTIMR
jgi:hypothetical protein